MQEHALYAMAMRYERTGEGGATPHVEKKTDVLGRDLSTKFPMSLGTLCVAIVPTKRRCEI